MDSVVILIPAAGASRRMRGADKLLQEIDGTTQLRRAAQMAVLSDARVVVTVPESGPLVPGRRAALMGLDLRILPVRDAHEGMAGSLRTGAGAAGDAEGLMVLPPDMPEIEPADIALLLTAFAEDTRRPVRAATEDGEEGHPVIFPRRLFPELMVLSGDRGGRSVLLGEDALLCPLPGRRAVVDLDTPEEWEAWLAARGSQATT